VADLGAMAVELGKESVNEHKNIVISLKRLPPRVSGFVGGFLEGQNDFCYFNSFDKQKCG